MTQRRSKRTAAVTKRRLSEETLERRKGEAEIRKLKNRSRTLEELRKQELDSFTKEAAKLSDLVDRLVESDSELEDSVETLEKTVNEIIEGIHSLHNSPTDKEELETFNLSKEVSRRRNTSTNNGILDDPVEVNLIQFPALSWPPRSPSQGSEGFNPFETSSINKGREVTPILDESFDSDVFETEAVDDVQSDPELTNALSEQILTDDFKHLLRPDLRYSSPDKPVDISVITTDNQNLTMMEEGEFKRKIRVVKAAKLKVKNAKKKFTAENVTDMHLDVYRQELKNIRNNLDSYDDVVTELVLDLNAENNDDQQRITAVGIEQEELLEEVLKNENEVLEKVRGLLSSKPLTKAEQEGINLKMKQMEIDADKEKNSKIEKTKKIEVDKEDILKRTATLKRELTKVASTKSLLDQEVRELLQDSKRWKNEMKEIEASKVKLKKDLISVGSEASSEIELESAVKETFDLIEEKIADLKSADSERCLFSLSRTVKELAVYPEAFGGGKGENVYKFRDKMIEAITANQIREKDKVDVLRKHLRKNAKDLIGDHYKTFQEAIDRLVVYFGLPKNTWESTKDNFIKQCNKPLAWMNEGSQERLIVIAKTCEFLRESEQLANDYRNELGSTINSDATVEMVISILPAIIRREVIKVKKLNKMSPEEVMKRIKVILEEEHEFVMNETAYSKGVQDGSAAYNACMNTFEKPKKPFKPFQSKNQVDDEHDCQTSGRCNLKWKGLGCAMLYELPTVEERRQLLRARNLCWGCGLEFGKDADNHQPNRAGKYPRLVCKTIIEEVHCNKKYCTLGAALCSRHQPGNASNALKDWLKFKQIRSTISTIISVPMSNSCSHNKDSIPPSSVKLSADVRKKLQKGDISCLFSNDQLTELFINDLKKEGVKNPRVDPMPEGEVAFIFCMIKGKKSDVQVFIDPGCNCAIMKDGIPQQEFDSCKLQNGPIQIDVATGISVNAEAEWGIRLPLENGSYQAVRGLTVSRVTSDMPRLRLKKVLKKIKTENKSFDHQNIQVPEKLGGEIHMILGIQFNRLHPEPLFTLPNGLTIYKSKFLPAKPNELACIGGPIEAVDSMVVSTGAKSAVRFMSHLIRTVSAGTHPRLEFFPSSVSEMERCQESFIDKDIPGIDECPDIMDEESFTEATENDSVEETSDVEEDELSDDPNDEPTVQKKFDEIKVPEEEIEFNVICTRCGDKVQFLQGLTIQSEMKRFLEQQEAGLDSSFRCIRCRDCEDCLKGAGQERMSMMQEAQQKLIKESVFIDKEKGRAVAKLPFLTDPAGKLRDNTRIAERRLESVCRKYSKDENVKQMITAGFKKLFDNDHIVLLDDLPQDIQEKIKNAKPSYTIPWDVAFKEGSLSTPARPVFDASSKTPGGVSLNDLLAKGQPDLVRLLDMVLAWRMGPSALTGDIRQFYNTILLLPDYWQFQKILLKENLDPQARTVVAIVKTLIYGVRPVGSQCEEVIKLIAEEVVKEHPEVSVMLTMKRYVDDFAQSSSSNEETVSLIEKTTEVLSRIGMKVKGWTVSGEDPPENLTDDGASVGFAGKTWFPKGDFFKLNIQSLHFAKKKRGKFPSDLVKFDKSGLTVEEYTPAKITRTNCTSVCARIYDTEGLLTPLTLKLKNDLRNLIKFEPSWNHPIPDHQRQTWINNFKTIEDVRDILYLRCVIPGDAVSNQARVLLLCDAADVGIVLAAYVCYERPGDVWSCDLLFGKGLLAQENWTIPQKELHGMSALSNVKVILENALVGWLRGFFAFTDSEIAICWSAYERVKLTTFVRNRVINIRTKMGLDILHHVDGKENPTDVGTRPELITAESVRPGSVWMKGKPWMQMSIEKAKEVGVIKTVEDIKLTNDKKKVFKEGIVYDTFEEADPTIFAVAKGATLDSQKIFERQVFSNYIFPPLKRSFKAMVRITALVIVAAKKFKKLLLKKQIQRSEKPKSVLKSLDFDPPKFTVFNCQVVLEPTDQNLLDYKPESLQEYFSIDGVSVQNYAWCQGSWTGQEEPNKSKQIKITDEQLSAALENLFVKATEEVIKFNDKKEIEKMSVKHEGILFYKTRLLEAAELKAVGHIADTINMENFTGVNFKVPLVDAHSPLAHSIALHLHYVKFPHRGAETLHRTSLQYCKILKGRKIFTLISQDCVYCKIMRKRLMDQMMGHLADCQTSISPIFYFCLVDLWGPLRSFVPGYEKVTRSTANKPHEVYMMVFACCATGTVNCQIIEGRKTGYCLDGFNRLFSEIAVPKICYPDLEGGLVKALSEGEVDMVDLSGALSRQKGIKFVPVVPQGHSAHGRIEKRIHMLQQSLERSEIRNSRCTATGWQTIAKAIERTVNSIPIGFYHHQSGGQNPLLRVLTPNSLKLVTTSDRAPVGLFNIPNGPTDIMENIQQKYESWYHVWNEQYLPLIMDRQKWHFRKENLQPNDIVYFKLTESKMSANWLIGKVEEVIIGRDGFVREATIAYKDTSSNESDDWIHRTVSRPVRNMVKLFHLDDTCLMNDLNAVHKLAQEILDEDKISYEDKNFTEVEDEKFDAQTMKNDEENVPTNLDEEKVQKPKRKRRTEIENLEIQMKGWNEVISGSSTTPAYPHTTASIDDQVPMSQNFQAIHAMTDALDYEENETREVAAAESRCGWEITDTVGVEGQSNFEKLCNYKDYDETYEMYLI